MTREETSRSDSWPILGCFADEHAPQELTQLLHECSSMGLGAIQLWGDLLARSLASDDEARRIGQELRDVGIQVVALAGYSNLIAPDPAQREAALRNVERCLEVSAFLGTNVVATETGTLNPDSPWEDSPLNRTVPAWDALEESLTRLLARARRCGSVLALEGYVNNVLATQEQMTRVLDRFAGEPLRVVCDPYNYCSIDLLENHSELTRQFFSRFAGSFAVAHLKDVDPAGAQHDTPEFGTGVFDQPSYLVLLREHRPDLPLIFEHLPWAHLPAAIARMKRIAMNAL